MNADKDVITPDGSAQGPAPIITGLKAKIEHAKIAESLMFFPDFLDESSCQICEMMIDELLVAAKMGHFTCPRTVDASAKRHKYFFGYGYTYGKSKEGTNELLPEGSVDPIPLWLQQYVAWPMEQCMGLPQGWIDSVVINDYRHGGSIVAHIDPPQLFARPILSLTLFGAGKLVFGASFDPQRRQPPLYEQLLTRGSLLSMQGYAADNVTHGMRPEDLLSERRVSIVLRHVLEEAPRYRPLESTDEENLKDLVQKVQGHWRDGTWMRFYIVRGLEVTVYKSDIELSDADHVRIESLTKTGAWVLKRSKKGLLCNGGYLDRDGIFPERILFRPFGFNEKQVDVSEATGSAREDEGEFEHKDREEGWSWHLLMDRFLQGDLKVEPR